MSSESNGRTGFLPMDTNLWDRFFISVVVATAIHLFWLRFLEAHIDLAVATVISVVLAVYIMRKG